MKKLFLVDGSAYFFRAYYALPPMSTSKGLPSSAIYGFANMLLKLIKDHSPEYLAMVFDSKEPTFREEIFSDYKANRGEMPDELSEQIPYIKKVVDAFQVSTVEKAGFEADDLIAALVDQLKEKDLEIVIVSSDKDLMQLVDPSVIMYDPMPKKEKYYDVKAVEEKWGVPPEKVADILALMGDSSDNIPGVPGVGPKTATKLINEHGSLKGLLSNLSKIKKESLRKKLTENVEQAELSYKLVTLETDVGENFKLTDFNYPGVDNDQVVELFRELEFSRLLKGLDIKRSEEKAKESVVQHKDYVSIMDEKTLDQWISNLERAGRFAVDTETDALDPLEAKLVGISFAFEDKKGIQAAYLPLRHDSSVVPNQLDLKKTLEKLKPLLESEKTKKICQHLKYDYLIFKNEGITLKGLEDDTMLISYCLNPSSQHGLDSMALRYLDHQNISYEEVAGKGKSQVTFDKVPLDKATPYAAEDAEVTLRLSQILSEELSENAKLEELYRNIELPLAALLAEMEECGFKVDVPFLTGLQKEFEDNLSSIEKKIYREAGEEFNINSNKQLQTILFDKLGLPFVKRTKSGFSTDSEVLNILAQQHALAELLLQYRELSKLKSTYIDSLIELADENSRVHTSYNQVVTATGRLSSSSPNLQNIPIRTEMGIRLREAFITEPGWSLISADYSQVELRILAHLSHDKELIKAFQEGVDIHTSTAAQVFGVTPLEVNADMRRLAKAINFGIIYGISPFGLSKQLEISQTKAKEYIDSYFALYKGVKKFLEQTIEEAKENGFVTTLMGRLRYLPDLYSKNPAIRGFAERTAMNSPMQGTAADLIKLAMLRTDEKIKSKKLKARLILQVHDELILEAPKEELEQVVEITKDSMEKVMPLSVPLEVSISVGKNWREAK
ncbi:DNA polymerase I [Bdellovibrionota bacterium]